MNNPQTLKITLNDNSYPIIIDANRFNLEALTNVVSKRKIMLVSNTTVAPLYLKQVVALFPENKVFSCVLEDGEVHKNINSWQHILDQLAAHQFNRSDLLVSLGGGVICDMTGFAAASWMRGIDFIQMPTTLLSQIDASVGGKTGINHPQGKNLIGAFHQPKAVIINVDTLNTLPAREFNAGIGEAIKYGGINQPDFFGWLSEHVESIKQRDPLILQELIAQCCQFKADIVEQDEKEQGVRALLNLGHTFGHAIETITDYQYLHGEAVGLGMVMAAELSQQLGHCDSDIRKMLENLLQAFDLPIKLDADVTSDGMLQLMKADKKVINNQHRLILMKGLGAAFIAEDIKDSEITAALKCCLTHT
ncbi:3-dehydroquinate synthase [Marinicella sp. S1101]|uniref:3-dehydroquinate synthase n=1 Tax=Marinicella marina TaxID=2996016 RepID=UPI002260F8CF|nr:3-dehydroquinate synthase [Marinicella marina]MCX7552292.1 3-dehydroquinate synthase [Marinicella marina]MDJ1139168.1 3-dehydroquinate synthase [Marinicella marina]